MGSDWKEYLLGEVSHWSSGGTPSKKKPEYWSGDIPWISASSMSGNRYKNSENKITTSGLEAGSRLAEKDSILLLVRGSILHQKIPVGIAEIAVSFNQDVKAIKVDEQFLEPWFLLLWFMANEKKLLSIVESTGIGAGKLDTKTLQEIPIRIPPKHIRQKILSFGKSLDDKIQLNHQTNQTLESIAQAIFKSWFVDFDPVKAKIATLEAGGSQAEAEQAAMMAISAKSADELSQMQADDPEAYQQLAETAALFPAKLVESELGLIPEGWVSDKISNIARIDTSSVQPKKSPSQSWQHYSIPAFDSAHHPVSELGSEIKSGKYLVKDQAILVSKLNPTTPRIWWVSPKDSGTAICSTEFMQFVPTNEKIRGFVYCLISSDYFQNQLLQTVTGSTGSRQRAQPKQVVNIDIIKPDLKLTFLASRLFSAILEKTSQNIIENVRLASTRDTLLPKLLSGEIDLSQLPTDEADP